MTRKPICCTAEYCQTLSPTGEEEKRKKMPFILRTFCSETHDLFQIHLHIFPLGHFVYSDCIIGKWAKAQTFAGRSIQTVWSHFALWGSIMNTTWVAGSHFRVWNESSLIWSYSILEYNYRVHILYVQTNRAKEETRGLVELVYFLANFSLKSV